MATSTCGGGAARWLSAGIAQCNVCAESLHAGLQGVGHLLRAAARWAPTQPGRARIGRPCTAGGRRARARAGGEARANV